MTIHISLSSNEAGPSTSTSKYSTPSYDPQEDLKNAIRCLRNSKRIVVVSGAGVSTGANIPDFRSSSGLFNDGVKGKGKGKVNGGSKEDLFHVKCLSSHTLLSAHQALITSLASLADKANPTPFHYYLSSLASTGQLLRCYTQNIDSLESKAGLRIGIPSSPKPKPKSKSRKKRNHGIRNNQFDEDDLFDPLLLDSSANNEEPEIHHEPQVVPLHGLIDTLKCTLCSTILPIKDYLPLPDTIPCPTCKLSSTIREALSERQRPIGKLRSNIILYGEEHPQSELIGNQVEKDLSRLDCLLVVGTSLSVPGIKRMVKEMSKALHHRGKHKFTQGRQGKGNKVGNGMMGKVILINNEFPKGDWRDIFDYWIQTDIQDFTINYLANQEYSAIPAQRQQREMGIPVTPKKRKVGKPDNNVFPPTPESLVKPSPRSRSGSMSISKPTASTTMENNCNFEIEIITPKKNKRKREVEVEIVLPTPTSLKKSKYRKISSEGEERERERDGTPTPLPT